MILVYADEFRKRFERLPAEIQDLYRTQEAILKLNWRDPRLHVKKLKGHPFPFSFRITRRYRAFFFFGETDTIVLATIGHRKDAYE
jgi:mRNA-degrading endonuclease RelE of RelBE toxin-antitoxin system